MAGGGGGAADGRGYRPRHGAPLLAAVGRGDRNAFRQLYSVTSSKLFGVALRILGNRAEAEETVQDVYAKVWTSAARFDGTRGRGMTWLIAIARNRSIDRLRARPDRTDHEADIADTLHDGALGIEATLVARGEMGRLSRCFDTLPADRAAAVRGAYLNGQSYDDLARHHAVPLNTMRTWLRRALIALRECLDQ